MSPFKLSEDTIDDSARELEPRPRGTHRRAKPLDYWFRGRYWEHDWPRVAARLGVVPDYLLAAELATRVHTVMAMRQRLGIRRAPGVYHDLRARALEVRRLNRLVARLKAGAPVF